MRAIALVLIAACASAPLDRIPPKYDSVSVAGQRADGIQRAADSTSTDSTVVKQTASAKTQDPPSTNGTGWLDRRELGVAMLVTVIVIGIVQTIVFILLVRGFITQKTALTATSSRMREIADAQAKDTVRALGHSKASADAATMAAEATKLSVQKMDAQLAKISEIATAVQGSANAAAEASNHLGAVTELQSRAFLSVKFAAVVDQDKSTGQLLEPRMWVVNDGNTPAYKVRFRTGAGMFRFPLPDDFAFPLSDDVSARIVNVLGPRQQKLMTAVAPRPYTEDEIERMKYRDGSALYMWGVVTYDDAFGKPRFVKFSHGFTWFKDGSVLSVDTHAHNDSD